MLGKSTIKKATRWLGKTVPKVIHTVDNANQWLGKELKAVKQGYTDLKQKIIKDAGVLRPVVRELITDVETSPLGQFISSAVKQVEMRQQQADDVLHSAKAVQKFIGS